MIASIRVHRTMGHLTRKNGLYAGGMHAGASRNMDWSERMSIEAPWRRKAQLFVLPYFHTSISLLATNGKGRRSIFACSNSKHA